MSRRAYVFVLLWILLSLIALQSGRQMLLSLSYLLGTTLLFSFVWAWLNLRWVGLSRLTQSLRAQVGRPVEERLTIHNRSVLPKLWLEVEDASELPGHQVSRVVHSLPAQHSRSWTTKTNARYRGRYRLGPMRIISGDPFGLFTFKRELPQSSMLTIYPATYELPTFAPPIGRLMGGDSVRRRTHNVTPNFASTRDYVPGDAFNRIHWPSSARTGRLIVKEFEEDPSADIWVVLDMHERSYVESEEATEWLNSSPSTAWIHDRKPPEILPITTEYVVTIGASLVRHFLGKNREVGMVAYAPDRQILQPDRGLRLLTRALEYLSVLQATGDRTLQQVLILEEKFFARGSMLLVVTSDWRDSWINSVRELQRRGVQVTAVLVNPASFDPQARSTDEVAAALASQGIPSYIVNKGDYIPDALRTPITF